MAKVIQQSIQHRQLLLILMEVEIWLK